MRVFTDGKPNNYFIKDWKNSESFRSVNRFLHGIHAREAAIAKPSFDGVVLPYRDFTVRMGDHVLTGASADGIILQAEQAAAIASGDCPTTIIANRKTGEAGFLHCSLKSCLPQSLRHDTWRSGSPYNVIETFMRQTAWNPTDLSVSVHVGIGPAYFDHPANHPTYEFFNRTLIQYLGERYPGEGCTPGDEERGCIDLLRIICAECKRFGVMANRITSDLVDTAADSTREKWWSVRRGDREGRNVVVACNW